ncbi:RES family NAD+ phosphorylase [Tessaracoccus sp. OH4464_COT-324]|uniref:RES family NAD+ phosphorylase n=1 Tax=Tessaracoccus sp. OH4464_COT-324 TaxID=2491059 RepID=UPI000F63BF2C|nr:RES family NAD+ phosphorylase [Tessaracoccus sp. OH4464_COT-324]RRD47140.1 hypothetical protein EII42_03940 [Tessaracoccus sp. OH4464_COT-324]
MSEQQRHEDQKQDAHQLLRVVLELLARCAERLGSDQQGGDAGQGEPSHAASRGEQLGELRKTFLQAITSFAKAAQQWKNMDDDAHRRALRAGRTLIRLALCLDTALKILPDEVGIAQGEELLEGDSFEESLGSEGVNVKEILGEEYLQKCQVLQRVTDSLGQRILAHPVYSDLYAALKAMQGLGLDWFPAAANQASPNTLGVVDKLYAALLARLRPGDGAPEETPLEPRYELDLLEEEEVLRQNYRLSNGQPLDKAELEKMRAEQHIIFVHDWDGVVRYPTFQFATLTQRKRKRSASGRWPFLRHDVYEVIRNTPHSFNGWTAAFWFTHVLRERIKPNNLPPAKVPPPGRLPAKDHTVTFRDLLTQKNLWVKRWQEDGTFVFDTDNLVLAMEELPTTLYRVTKERYCFPYWYTAQKKLHNNRYPLWQLRGEKPQGRFDTWCRRGKNRTRGTLYLATTARGCFLEVFDREPILLLQHVMKKLWILKVNPAEKFTVTDLTRLSSYLSSTPVRSATQVLADALAYSNNPTHHAAVYRLRSTSGSQDLGVLLFDAVKTCDEGNEPKCCAPKASAQEIAESNNHDPSLGGKNPFGTPISISYGSCEDLWQALNEMKESNWCRDTLLLLRRIPPQPKL